MKKMLWFIAENYLMGATFTTDTNEIEVDNGMGILKNHAYGLLSAQEAHGVSLVELRNPWGDVEWRGAYSDNAKEWTPSLMKEFGVEKFEDDGTFFMSLPDFQTNYNNLIALRLLQDDKGKMWTRYCYNSFWKGKNSGGCPNYPTWKNNFQFHLKSNINTNAFFVLSQEDERLKWNLFYDRAIGMYLVKNDKPAKKLKCPQTEVAAVSAFAPNRDVTFEFCLQANQRYNLVPSCFDPNTEGEFWITIWTEDPLDECFLIPDLIETSCPGQWSGVTAGGCTNNPSAYENNPKYYLIPENIPSGPLALSLSLRQDNSTNFHIAMNGGKYNGTVPNMNSVIYRNTHQNAKEVFLEITLNPQDWPIYIVPNTFNQGSQSKFELTARSTQKILIQPLIPNMPLTSPISSETKVMIEEIYLPPLKPEPFKPIKI